MVGFDTYLKAFAALVGLVFAFIVLAARARGPYVFLGTFLLLIAGNQGAETLRGFAADAAAGRPFYVTASLFAAFDPLALFLFARAFVGKPTRGAGVTAAAVGAAALAGLALFLGDPSVDRAHNVALLVYTGATYAAVFVTFLGAAERAPHDGRPRALVYATGLVMLLPFQQLPNVVTHAVVFDLMGGRDPHPAPSAAEALAWPILLAALLVVCVAASRAWDRPTRRLGVSALALGIFATAVVSSQSIAQLLLLASGQSWDPSAPWVPGVVVLGRASAAVRWIAFGALVSTVVLREDLLGMSLARRRASARALVALGIAGTLGILYAAFAILFGAESLVLRPLDWLMLSVVMLATQGFRPLIDGVAARLYGVPNPSDRVAAHETYRRAAQQAVDEGRDTRTDPELIRLREELRIGATQATLIERVAEESHDGPLVAGQRVAGRYHVRRLVGRGGAGRVFLARDDTLDRDVVLKEVLHDAPGDDAGVREARAAGAVLHPNVVIVHDIIRRGGASLLVTEYVSGGSLAERLQSEGRLPVAQGLRLLDGVLAGLEAVHARGLVHRDLKPDNVLLCEDGSPKIADFGIARARRGHTARFDEPDAFIGTPEFMAPEQRAGTRATAATDVWAAATLARCAIASPLPAPVEAVLARALAEDPATRYQDAGAMRAALRGALSS